MKKKEKYYCSFCGKSQDAVDLIIAGPEDHDICSECVDVCVDHIYEFGAELPSVNSKLGRQSKDFVAELGIKPRFSKVNIAQVEDQCFYLCPFSEPFNSVFRDHVAPTVKGLGLTIKRADDIFGTQPIVDDIWEGICESSIILADVTGRNPNVMYEIGLAHTIGKPVVIITQSIDDVPFDLRHYRCIIYSYNPRGIKELEERLIGTLGFLRRSTKEKSSSRSKGVSVKRRRAPRSE
jgi:hypothetical protein